MGPNGSSLKGWDSERLSQPFRLPGAAVPFPGRCPGLRTPSPSGWKPAGCGGPTVSR